MLRREKHSPRVLIAEECRELPQLRQSQAAPADEVIRARALRMRPVDHAVTHAVFGPRPNRAASL
jgi:hypothetical protein